MLFCRRLHRQPWRWVKGRVWLEERHNRFPRGR
jgi:hypothetical protein